MEDFRSILSNNGQMLNVCITAWLQVGHVGKQEMLLRNHPKITLVGFRFLQNLKQWFSNCGTCTTSGACTVVHGGTPDDAGHFCKDSKQIYGQSVIVANYSFT